MSLLALWYPSQIAALDFVIYVVFAACPWGAGAFDFESTVLVDEKERAEWGTSAW